MYIFIGKSSEKNNRKKASFWYVVDDCRHVVNISSELLLKMFTHNIELRIWDTKEKVGAKARFTKPKQFKIPNSKPGKAYSEVHV